MRSSLHDSLVTTIPNLRAFAFSLTHNPDRADDFVQETLLRALVHLDRFEPGTRCLIPGFDGAILSSGWRDALWAKFSMGAPQRQRRSVEQYKIVKRA